MQSLMKTLELIWIRWIHWKGTCCPHTFVWFWSMPRAKSKRHGSPSLVCKNLTGPPRPLLHLWDELERRLEARSYSSTSASDRTWMGANFWSQVPKSGTSSQKSAGCYSIRLMSVVFKWYVQQPHIGVTIDSQHTFGHVVYLKTSEFLQKTFLAI